MPRLKSQPTHKRSLIDSVNNDNEDLDDVIIDLIDDNSSGNEEEPPSQRWPAKHRQRRRRQRKRQKTDYEFAVDKQFEQFIADANLFLTIHYHQRQQQQPSNQTTAEEEADVSSVDRPSPPPPPPDSCHCHLCSFSVRISPPQPSLPSTASSSSSSSSSSVSPQQQQPLNDIDIDSVNQKLFYLYVKHKPLESCLYYECNHTKTGRHIFGNKFKTNNTNNNSDNNKEISYELIESLNTNSLFYLTTNLVTDNDQWLTIDVWLIRSAVHQLDYHSQTVGPPNMNMMTVMNHFYGYEEPIYGDNNLPKDISNEFIGDLYAKIKQKHNENQYKLIDYDVQHRSLYPKLRQYQRDAVQWMLNREQNNMIQPYQRLYETVVSVDGLQTNYNKYLGFFIDDNNSSIDNYVYGISRSGILADEMGLGKTIEVLANILCNPKPVGGGGGDDDHIDEDTGSYDADIQQESLDDDYDEYDDECFACVCGELCNIRWSRKRNLILNDNDDDDDDDVVVVDDDDVNNGSDTEIEDNNVDNDDCVDDDDDDDDKQLQESPYNNNNTKDLQMDNKIRKIAVHRFVNHKPVVEIIDKSLSSSRGLKRRKAKQQKQRLKTLVRCRVCRSYQHSSCVNYRYDDDNDSQKPRRRRRPYYCGHCWVRPGMKRVESRATLIVSPRSISHQWQDEIVKHVDCSGLSVYVYEGVKSKNGYIQPFDLADNDIVLTTYETLRSEIDYVDLHHSNRFRYPKRFNSTPSPLVTIDWWRICLDEAQMVESALNKTAQMAHRLYARHRWCITGTPIQRSLNDIYGLLLFIGEEPYHERHYWHRMLYWPYTSGITAPMVQALSQCFWRQTKQDVWQQLDIPEQTVTTKTLRFSPVEQHFYLRQYWECNRKLNDKIKRFSDLSIKLKDLDRKTVSLLMTPMLTLRQACCHPQAVRGKFLPISKKTMTMDEVLKTMIKSTQYECEEEHRKFIAALNGQAACHIIQKNYEKAIEQYRRALASMVDYKAKDLFRTDKLQQIHTLHNLADIFDLCGIRQIDKTSGQRYDQTRTTEITVSIEIIGRTLRDEFMRYESIQLRDEYLAKGLATVTEVTKQLDPLIETVGQLQNSFESSKQLPWWKLAIDYFRTNNDDEINLIQRVKDVLETHSLKGRLGEEHLSTFVSIADDFREASGLVYVLDKCLRELHHSRSVLQQRVRSLSPKPTDRELNEAIDCHLRPERDKEGNRANSVVSCKYCRIHELFNDYEKKLFYFSVVEKTEESACKSNALMEKQRRGNWGDSELEQSLKVINQLFRQKASASSLPQHRMAVDDGQTHMKLFDALKKEFRGLRAVWTTTYDFVSQIDELNMATIRLRERLPDEPKPKETITYILEPNEVGVQLITLNSDEVIAKSLLTKRLSHLHYLNNLSNDESTRKGGRNPELCPICQHRMGQQWVVLQCGHSLCVKCLDILINEYSRKTSQGVTIGCPMCRELCPLSAILYVNATETDDDDDIAVAGIEVAGSWSTKVEEVVRCLLEIISADSTAKTLVFSTWVDVLQLISTAMDDNKISHVFIRNSAKFSQKVDNFKTNREIKALLMPMDLGAKGLNLIEATHVVLVEPTLNRANELQAVGRVHRIGQTKPTLVHRFVVKNTIEERIAYLYDSPVTATADAGNESTKRLQLADQSEYAYITLDQMKRLFENYEN
ncbi:E3 ubiquitin-protein ligase SHPRH-like [Oppia nitens]|uniref:E3 ubiquitin-protein ligase SHPRH-like n=1 Tax=Oppia nitens TaxID=1686743 RepID=UPI0023DB643F|nr:E3 ubiquitin-protein ligase SHPRH-like [Oppia nitens]